MKHNILIHNLAEDDGENLFIKIPALIKEHLGIDTKFSNIHRNGWGYQDKPRSITARLINFPDKEKILSAHKERKDKVPKLPFLHYSTATYSNYGLQEEAGRSQYKIQRG